MKRLKQQVHTLQEARTASLTCFYEQIGKRTVCYNSKTMFFEMAKLFMKLYNTLHSINFDMLFYP